MSYIISHADFDGILSAIIVYLYDQGENRKDIEYLKEKIHYAGHSNFQRVLEKVLDRGAENIYILDYSPQPGDMEKIVEAVNSGVKVVFIDHHQATYNVIERYIEKIHGEFDITLARTPSTADLLLLDRTELLLRYPVLEGYRQLVNTIDSGGKPRSREEQVVALLEILTDKHAFTKILLEAITSNTSVKVLGKKYEDSVRVYEEFLENEVRLIEYSFSRTMKVVDAGNVRIVYGEIISQHPPAVKKLLDKLLERYDVVVLVNKATRRGMVRSKHTSPITALEIASRLNGGGHVHAAGFPFTDRKTVLRVVNKLSHMYGRREVIVR